MKKAIKFLIITDVFCVIMFVLLFFYLQSIENKSYELYKQRQNLVEQYMIDNNFPTYGNVFIDIDDRWLNSYIDEEEKKNKVDKKISALDRFFLDIQAKSERAEKIKLYREQFRIQYRNIDNQIYQKEQEVIDNLNQTHRALQWLPIFFFCLFCILSSIVVLYFIIIFIIPKTPIKQIDFKNNLNQIIPIIASIVFLLFAIFEIEIIEEAAFYSLLRIIVSATLFYIAFVLKDSKSILFWLAISAGILFNPFVQIHLNDSGLWNIIDVCTIIYLISYTVIKLQRKK